MKNLDHWFICLDLSKMDNVLMEYARFLSNIFQPATISFFHVIESDSFTDEMVELFPDVHDKNEVESMIREELTSNINELFSDSDAETRLILKKGRPTNQIIEMMNTMDPDLLIMGKKKEYVGEGVVARRITKYVPSSILFVPETSRHSIKNILAPIDFSRESAQAVHSALQISDITEASVTAQHIFKYPSRFFPYMPSDKDRKKVDDYIHEKKENYIGEYDIPGNVNFELTLHREDSLMDQVYDETVRQKTDLLIASSKSRNKITGLLREDFTDKMIYYSFGIPLLVLKDKQQHKKYLHRLFE